MASIPHRLSRTAVLWLLAPLLLLGPVPHAAAQTVIDEIAVARDATAAERTAFVAESMQFTESEGVAFWPLYREYRGTMETLGDGMLKLVLEYSDVYPDMPEERAAQLLKDYVALERQYAETRAEFLQKVAKAMTAAKALRLAQVENRLDATVRLQLASVIPLVTTDKK